MENNKKNTIDISIILKRMGEKKKLFFIVLPIVFVLSCLYIICIPRYYTSEIKLVPETDNSMGGGLGSLGSIASSLGVDINSMNTTDAISPTLYPDLMEDNGFVAGLFPIHVESDKDSENEPISTTYYDYLENHQKAPWWGGIISSIKKTFASDDSDDDKRNGTDEFNPYRLSKKQEKVMEKLRGNVSIDSDTKTGVLTISVKAQDPYISKTMADSIKERLQTFITEYRTSKTRLDLQHYLKLESNAKKEYEAARLKYGKYADAHTDVALESYRVNRDDLENDMQLKYNTYSSLQTQVQLARAKLQASTPAFTMIKGADVPNKPTGPKRMIFVILMMFLAFTATLLYSIKGDLRNTLNS